MKKTITLFFVSALFCVSHVYGQEAKHPIYIGFNYGFGNEVKNTDYTYTNHYYKLQWYYGLKKGKSFQKEILIQPEINFATHQLINFYFVQPSEPNYEVLREEFTQLKDINQYIINIGFLMRKPISKKLSLYGLLSVGPMYNDTRTERLPKGFAFSDVLSLGVTYTLKKFNFDFRPNVRHASNANLKLPNSGINTFNLEFGVSVPL